MILRLLKNTEKQLYETRKSVSYMVEKFSRNIKNIINEIFSESKDTMESIKNGPGEAKKSI